MSEIIKTGPFEGWTDIMPITETAEKKLRPCAFCGRMPKTIYAVFSFTRREVCTQVVCMHKGCPVEYTEAPVLRMFSVMEWNARPIEDARAARIAELEAERDRLRKALRGLMQAVDGCLTPSEALLWKKCEEAMKGSEIGQRGGKTH